MWMTFAQRKTLTNFRSKMPVYLNRIEKKSTHLHGTFWLRTQIEVEAFTQTSVGRLLLPPACSFHPLQRHLVQYLEFRWIKWLELHWVDFVRIALKCAERSIITIEMANHFISVQKPLLFSLPIKMLFFSSQ